MMKSNLVFPLVMSFAQIPDFAAAEALPGTEIFIFQPAEEGAPEGEEGGAELMLKQGIFSNLKPEAVLGMRAMTQVLVDYLETTATK